MYIWLLHYHPTAMLSEWQRGNCVTVIYAILTLLSVYSVGRLFVLVYQILKSALLWVNLLARLFRALADISTAAIQNAYRGSNQASIYG